jgi:hypothetical protein
VLCVALEWHARVQWFFEFALSHKIEDILKHFNAFLDWIVQFPVVEPESIACQMLEDVE